ncbi:MAG: hypothetical protein KIG65_05545 [Eubacteriales bacterium]|nr:hypothetical protein [Eubacteriales bacterium]
MSRITKWLIAALVVFAAGVTVGSFSAVSTEPKLLYDYFAGLAGGEIRILTSSAVISALTVWTVLFFSAFFKFGAITTAIAVGMRGFTDGYSVTAILRILGTKGVGMCFLDILGVPLVLIMAATVMCVLSAEKKNLTSYLAVSGLCLLLLLGASLLTSAVSSSLAGFCLKGITF